MLTYALKRLLHAVPLLLGLSIVVFVLLHLAPGGPLSVYLENPNLRPEDVERLKRNMGLDLPLHRQYARWLIAFLSGDWGVSFVDGRSAFARIAERLPATVELMGTALALALLLAVVVAGVAASSQGVVLDRVASLFSLCGISLPTFWTGLMLQLVFAVGLGWFPSAGRTSPGGGGRLAHLVLPAATLALFYASSWIRFLRASLIEVLDAPYVHAARARGLERVRILFRHALQNALIPFTTVVSLDVALLLSGAVVTETVFAWPGMGSLLLESIHRRDYAVVMGILMSSASLIVLTSLLCDLFYGIIDPRVRAQAQI